MYLQSSTWWCGRPLLLTSQVAVIIVGLTKKSPFNSYRGESSEHETGRLEVKCYLLTVNSELFTGVNISTVRCLLLQFSQFSLHNASLLNQPVCCRSHIHNALLITVSIQRQTVAKTVITNESINLWKKLEVDGKVVGGCLSLSTHGCTYIHHTLRHRHRDRQAENRLPLVGPIYRMSRGIKYRPLQCCMFITSKAIICKTVLWPLYRSTCVSSHWALPLKNWSILLLEDSAGAMFYCLHALADRN